MRQQVTLPAIRKQRERNAGVQHSCFFLFMPVPVHGMVPVTFRVCLSSSVEPVWKIPHSPSEDCLPCDAKSSQADNQRYPSCLAKIPQVLQEPSRNFPHMSILQTFSYHWLASVSPFTFTSFHSLGVAVFSGQPAVSSGHHHLFLHNSGGHQS